MHVAAAEFDCDFPVPMLAEIYIYIYTFIHIYTYISYTYIAYVMFRSEPRLYARRRWIRLRLSLTETRRDMFIYTYI